MSDSRLPIVLIVDDPPINTTYWMRRQAEEHGFAQPPRGQFGTWVSRWRDQEPARIIPNSFWRDFAAWAKTAGVKGKFTFLPCPAGLGMIDDRLEGYSRDELTELVAIVREEIEPNFDITPEIMTHTLAWDIGERRLLPEFEHDWMARQSEETLAGYMAEALRILQCAGLRPTGITQPCNFRGDENLYARAVLRAMKQACGLTRTFYFLNCEAQSVQVASPVKIARPDSDEFVVSMVSAIRPDEPFWESLYGGGDVQDMAEYFISADGRRGRLVDLLEARSPLVFHCHSQTLFSNGSQRGFESLQLVVRRVAEHLAPRVRWMKAGDFAEWVVAGSQS